MRRQVTSSHSGAQYVVNEHVSQHQLPVSELTVGMQVVELDRPWDESPFIFQGFVIESQADIELLASVCQFVYVEMREEEWLEYQKHTLVGSKKKNYWVEKAQFSHKLTQANRTYQNAKVHIKSLLASAQLGQALSFEKNEKIVKECVDRVVENPNAILWLTRLKHQDEYTAEHCLNVSLLSIALGQRLDLSKWELENLGVCGLLHDIGKMKVPDEILNKPGKLTREEFAEMEKHSVYAKQMLMGRSDVYPGAVDVAFTHHERLDGKGYPRKVDGKKISLFTRIVTIVDAYDAMTSERCYKSAMSSLDALKIINQNKGTQFDEEIAQVFIEMIGLYPPGYLAKMTNGEVGIILSHDPNYQLKPKVILIKDKDLKSQPETIINLAHVPQDIEGQDYEIEGVYRSGCFGVNVEEFTKKGLQVKGFNS